MSNGSGGHQNDWPEWKRVVIQNQEDCRKKQDEQDEINDLHDERITEAHRKIEKVQDKLGLISAAIGGGVSIAIYFLQKVIDKIWP